MNKKILKIIVKVLFILLLIFIVFNNIFTSYAGDDVVGGKAIKDFEKGSNDPRLINTTVNVVGTVLNIVKVVTVGIALIMLIILAVKYMIASVEERAEIKKHAVIYVVGAIVMFGATGIISIIQTFAGVFEKA